MDAIEIENRKKGMARAPQALAVLVALIGLTCLWRSPEWYVWALAVPLGVAYLAMLASDWKKGNRFYEKSWLPWWLLFLPSMMMMRISSPDLWHFIKGLQLMLASFGVVLLLMLINRRKLLALLC